MTEKLDEVIEKINKPNPGRKIIYLGEHENKEKTRVHYDVNYEDEYVKTCMGVFRRLPWLKGNVEQIYVHPIAMPSTYYDPNAYIEHESNTFYKVKRKYYRMRCVGIVESFTDDVFTVNYEQEMLKFQVGIDTGKSGLIVQNREMHETEKNYLSRMKSSNINVNELKGASVSRELYNIGLISLIENTPDRKYAEKVLDNLLADVDNAYEFAVKIAKINTSVRFGNIFTKRLLAGYYNPNIIHLLDYDVLLDGVEYDTQEVDEYVEDSAINMLLYAHKYYDIPVRQYKKEKDRQLLKVNRLDVRLRCENLEEVKDVPEENLTFYDSNQHFFCYDIKKLYFDFKDGKTVNPHTGYPFSDEFVKKVLEMYKFKRQTATRRDSWTEADYDNAFKDEELDLDFFKVLEKVRFEIEKLSLDSEECSICRKKLGSSGLVTIGNDGQLLKHCSKLCFDKPRDIIPNKDNILENVKIPIKKNTPKRRPTLQEIRSKMDEERNKVIKDLKKELENLK